MALFFCWFVFHCHGNGVKFLSAISDIGGIRTVVRSRSNSTADTLAALFNV
jgi:hypothetical protein